jgi:cell wall-associated NlpC family hydrolase
MSEHWFEGVGLAESPFAEADSPFAGEVEALADVWPAETAGLPPAWPEDEEAGAGGEMPFAAEALTPWAPAEALAEGWGDAEALAEGWGDAETLAEGRGDAEEKGPGLGRLAADRLEWPGAPADQLAFMRAVYAKHLERSRAKGDTFTADLPEGQLGPIEGKHRARKDAAAAARALLAEARTALAAAGLADKVRIGIISAYRPASQQFDIWQGKGREGRGGFPHYYGEMLRQGRLRPGDFGPEAVSAMASELANWIAAPGYSNHQDGLAIDFGIGLVGRGLGKVGKKAWFHQWLVANAARHGFHPYHKEAWHWVYRGPTGSEALAGEVATAARPGELRVERVPLLAGHRGRPPDLLLRWNVTSLPEVVDVVVHLHGYWYAGLRLEDNIKPWSGLDLAPVGGAAGSGRSRPTLTVLPRGNDTGVKQPKGPFNRYTFPALVNRDGLPGLVRFSLERFAAQLGGTTPRVGRLILTAHSGGGAALLKILEHHDPHQVHMFDALYQDAGALAAWARRRIQRDRAELAASGAAAAGEYMATRGGALRVFYGRSTRYYSRKLQAAIAADLERALAPWYRVEASRYSHFQIPRRYGWRVLADAAADVPDAFTEPVTHRELDAPPETEEPRFEEQEDELEGELEDEDEDEVEAGEVELGEAEAFFDEVVDETGATVTFPSGASLRVVPGPTSKGEEHYDPAATSNPLLDTSEPVRSTLLSASFTVGELSRSGPHRFDKARIDPELVRSLQRLRDHLGKPMRITSSYRPYLYNDKLYKEKYKQKPTRSRHSSGQAADIHVAGMAGMEIAKAAIDVLGPDIGVGIAGTYAHVDVRGRWARWTYFGDGTEKHRLAIAEIDAYQRRRRSTGAPAASREQEEVEEAALEPEGEGGESPWVGLAEDELDEAEAGELAVTDTPMAGEGSLVDAIRAIPQAIGIAGALLGWLRDAAIGAPPTTAAQDFVERLIASGNRDRNKLTDIVFALAHSSVGTRRLDPNDPGDQPLITDWLNIRDRLVDPALRRAVSGHPTTATPMIPTVPDRPLDSVEATSVERFLADHWDQLARFPWRSPEEMRRLIEAIFHGFQQPVFDADDSTETSHERLKNIKLPVTATSGLPLIHMVFMSRHPGKVVSGQLYATPTVGKRRVVQQRRDQNPKLTSDDWAELDAIRELVFGVVRYMLPRITPRPAVSAGSSLGDKVAARAHCYLGVEYRLSAWEYEPNPWNTPPRPNTLDCAAVQRDGHGVLDCSMLVNYVYWDLLGRHLKWHKRCPQGVLCIAQGGDFEHVPAGDGGRATPRVGDLLLAGAKDHWRHIGIYVGDGHLIDAWYTGTVVRRRRYVPEKWSGVLRFTGAAPAGLSRELEEEWERQEPDPTGWQDPHAGERRVQLDRQPLFLSHAKPDTSQYTDYSPRGKRPRAEVQRVTDNGSFVSEVLRIITADKHFEGLTGLDGLTIGIGDFAAGSDISFLFAARYAQPALFRTIFGSHTDEMMRGTPSEGWLHQHASRRNDHGLIAISWLRKGIARLLADRRSHGIQLDFWQRDKVAPSLAAFRSYGFELEFSLAAMCGMANSMGAGGMRRLLAQGKGAAAAAGKTGRDREIAILRLACDRYAHTGATFRASQSEEKRRKASEQATAVIRHVFDGEPPPGDAQHRATRILRTNRAFPLHLAKVFSGDLGRFALEPEEQAPTTSDRELSQLGYEEELGEGLEELELEEEHSGVGPAGGGP